MTAIGEWSPGLYLNPQDFSVVFFPCSVEKGLWKSGLVELNCYWHMKLSQSFPLILFFSSFFNLILFYFEIEVSLLIKAFESIMKTFVLRSNH